MKKILIISSMLLLASCSGMVSMFMPGKTMSTKESWVSKNANAYFWSNFHQGNYDSIPNILQKLNMALVTDPNDLLATAHLGFTHLWSLSERQRLPFPNPQIIENLFLACTYYEEAYKLNPNDSRILGFEADMTLAKGGFFKNEKQQVEGYFMGKKAIDMWPQFNKFTVAYVFSSLGKDNENFKKGIKWQYETMNDCACKTYDDTSNYADLRTRVANSTDPMIYRACYNTWIAPHNWEGFFLNFGDMLVKAGNTAEALKMYQLAKQSDTYNNWPYRDVLENRINNIQKNATDFNKPIDNMNIKSQNVIMFNSRIACTGCHQMGKEEFVRLGYKAPTPDIYFLKAK